MNRATALDTKQDSLATDLALVRRAAADSLRETSVGPLVDEMRALLVGGKMLRARLALRLSGASDVPHAVCLRIAAAVEMIHAASLLHDDVIDHAFLRRGESAFWVTKGATGSILLGDLVVARAVKMMTDTGRLSLVCDLVAALGEMCDAEAQQELLLRNRQPDWATCVSIARRKTGSLFAFAAQSCAGENAALRAALREAGYAGTMRPAQRLPRHPPGGPAPVTRGRI